MPSLKDRLRAEIQEALEPANVVAKAAEDAGRDLTPDERTIVQKAFDSVTELKNRLQAAEGDEAMLKNLNALGLEVGDLAKGADSVKGIGRTMGSKFVEAENIKSWYSSLIPSKGGVVSNDTRVHSPQVQYGGMKDILAGGDTTDGPGLLVTPDRLGLIDQGLYQRELTVRNLVSNLTTGTDTIEYVQELAYTNNAAFVPEARGNEPYSAGAGQVEGKKPQSSFTLQKKSTTVKTVAHWMPITKRALSDATQIRSLIDSFLRYGLEEKLEDSMLLGDGTDEEFEGILETDGIQHQEWDTNLFVTTRKAKTKVRTVGKARATAFVFNPEDNERIDLLRDASGGDENTGQFMFGSPTGLQTQTLWGIPRIESDAVPAGTGIVADWRRAALWDREQAGIQLSDSHADFFIRNLVAILAELRAAFTVLRPAAFVEIDLTEAGS